MAKNRKLGWQQVEILRRCWLKPGMPSGALLDGLSRENSPHKKLQGHGLIEDRGDDRKRSWYITTDGEAELRRRDPALFYEQD